MMTVRCQECGKLNQKELDQHIVKCPECGETTVYYIFPGATTVPQTPAVIAIHRKKEREDLIKYKEKKAKEKKK